MLIKCSGLTLAEPYVKLDNISFRDVLQIFLPTLDHCPSIQQPMLAIIIQHLIDEPMHSTGEFNPIDRLPV